MAGTQNIGESSDNPVEINVVAMVDVIFCLCIFFMCSFHFKQLEGKIDTLLPGDRGQEPGKPAVVRMEEVRVFMAWDEARDVTLRKVGGRPPASSDAELMDAVLSTLENFRRMGKTNVPVVIDATRGVSWKDVVRVLDLCRGCDVPRIEFTAPMPARAGAARM